MHLLRQRLGQIHFESNDLRGVVIARENVRPSPFLISAPPEFGESLGWLGTFGAWAIQEHKRDAERY
jgi:hypothetical protein